MLWIVVEYFASIPIDKWKWFWFSNLFAKLMLMSMTNVAICTIYRKSPKNYCEVDSFKRLTANHSQTQLQLCMPNSKAKSFVKLPDRRIQNPKINSTSFRWNACQFACYLLLNPNEILFYLFIFCSGSKANRFDRTKQYMTNV